MLQGELWQAIEMDEFYIHYQPILDLVKMKCVGAEALIRWKHPDRGVIMPLTFIPIAEQTDMIRHITQWLIGLIESELEKLMGANPDLHISVNLSPADFGADGYKTSSNDLLFNRIPHQQIIYEITERNLVPDNNCVHEVM